jgi:CheY-like chemotaxis protein
MNDVGVLVVDDDRTLLRLMRLTLQDSGLEVTTAANGAEALERLETSAPSAIVLDLEMPEMDGRTFYREMRNRGYTAPVLILSAYGAREARRELKAEAHMSKPFDPEELLAALLELILEE